MSVIERAYFQNSGINIKLSVQINIYVYFNINFNVFFKLINVHLLVSELYMYQNARCND